MPEVSIDSAEIETLALEPGGWEELALTGKAIQVETIAKTLVHVDEGELRASITHDVEDDPAEGWVAYVGSPLNYAIYQELESNQRDKIKESARPDGTGDMFPDSPSSGKYAGMPREDVGGKAYLRPALYGSRNL